MQWSKWSAALVVALSVTPLVARAGKTAEPAPTTLRAWYGLKPPAELQAGKTALLLVDFQDEFVHGHLPLPSARAAIAHAAELAEWARRSGLLVVCVQNISNRPGSPLFVPGSSASAFVPELAPSARDLVVVKATGGAFSHTSLDSELHARGVDTLIVAGFMTHLAVLMTANDGALLGYHVLVAADATATRALPDVSGAALDEKTLQRAALATLSDRVADVLPGARIMALPVH